MRKRMKKRRMRRRRRRTRKEEKKKTKKTKKVALERRMAGPRPGVLRAEVQWLQPAAEAERREGVHVHDVRRRRAQLLS